MDADEVEVLKHQTERLIKENKIFSSSDFKMAILIEDQHNEIENLNAEIAVLKRDLKNTRRNYLRWKRAAKCIADQLDAFNQNTTTTTELWYYSDDGYLVPSNHTAENVSQGLLDRSIYFLVNHQVTTKSIDILHPVVIP